METYELSEWCVRHNVKEFVPGETDLFKIIRIRDNDRYDIMCICFGEYSSKFTGRIWKDISGTHLRKIRTKEMNPK